MTRRTIAGVCAVLTVAVALQVSVAGAVQKTPVFSGTWRLRTNVAGYRTTAGVFAGTRFKVTQDAKAIRVERYETGTPYTVGVTLDGRDTSNVIPMRDDRTVTVQCRSAWSGSQLIIRTRMPTADRAGSSVEFTETVSLADGELVVDRSAPMFGGGASRVSRFVYAKAQ